MDHSTPETTLLNKHPGIRERVAAMPEFVAWRRALPLVEVDDETFHVYGGDQLKDYDQIVVAWIHQFRPDILKGD